MTVKDKILDSSAYITAAAGGVSSLASWNEIVGLTAGGLGILLCLMRIWDWLSKRYKRRQRKNQSAN